MFSSQKKKVQLYLFVLLIQTTGELQYEMEYTRAFK